MTTDQPPAAARDAADLDVRVVRGSPTDDELAAILAVLHNLPPAPAHRPAPQAPAPSDWHLSQRHLRTAPLRRGWR